MRSIRKLDILFAIALALLLSACGSSQTTRFYGLQPEASRQQAPPAFTAGTVQITGFNVPALFDRDEIMREVSPGQFEIEEFDHWAAPFAQLARQTLSEDLAARLPPGAVAFPGTPAPVHPIQVSVNLLAYRVVGNSAQLEASWSVKFPPAGRDNLNRIDTDWQTTRAVLEAPIGEGGGAATAGAVNDLLARLSERIVASLLPL